jgi:hypothetical protein
MGLGTTPCNWHCWNNTLRSEVLLKGSRSDNSIIYKFTAVRITAASFTIRGGARIQRVAHFGLVPARRWHQSRVMAPCNGVDIRPASWKVCRLSALCNWSFCYICFLRIVFCNWAIYVDWLISARLSAKFLSCAWHGVEENGLFYFIIHC